MSADAPEPREEPRSADGDPTRVLVRADIGLPCGIAGLDDDGLLDPDKVPLLRAPLLRPDERPTLDPSSPTFNLDLAYALAALGLIDVSS